MRTRYSVDTRALEREIAAIDRASPLAGRLGVIAVAEDFTRRVLDISPRDTHRYVRAWAMAANAAGLGPFPVSSVQPSKFADKQLAFLKAQYDKWAFFVRRYERTGRAKTSDRSYMKARRHMDQAAKALEQFMERQQQGGGALLIGRRFTAGGSFAVGRRAVVSVRHRIYGGTGTITRHGAEHIVILHNQEAHASIIEANWRVVFKASYAGRLVGARRGSQVFIRSLQEAAKMTITGDTGGDIAA